MDQQNKKTSFKNLSSELLSTIASKLSVDNAKSFSATSKENLTAVHNAPEIVFNKIVDFVKQSNDDENSPKTLAVQIENISLNQEGQTVYAEFKIEWKNQKLNYYKLENLEWVEIADYNALKELLTNVPADTTLNIMVTLNDEIIDAYGHHKELYDYVSNFVHLYVLSYKQSTSRIINPQGGSQKQKVIIKGHKRALIVRIDEAKKKYVLLNKAKVYLSTIRGKYRYK